MICEGLFKFPFISTESFRIASTIKEIENSVWHFSKNRRPRKSDTEKRHCICAIDTLPADSTI